MSKTTLRELGQRLDELENEIAQLRQRVVGFSAPEVIASQPLDVDTALDQFFEAMGLQGDSSGLARLRALQTEQEQLWAQGRRNGAPSVGLPRAGRKGPRKRHGE